MTLLFACLGCLAIGCVLGALVMWVVMCIDIVGGALEETL